MVTGDAILLLPFSSPSSPRLIARSLSLTSCDAKIGIMRLILILADELRARRVRKTSW